MDKLIEDYVINSNTSQSNVETVCNEIKNGSERIANLFVSLEPYLTSKDNQKRQKAVRFTSELIRCLPSNYLNKQEVNHLSKFLCSKLEDHYTIAPAALPGLKVLIKHEQLEGENLIMIIRSILKDIHVQSLVQSDRYEVYTMCYYMLTNRVSIIKLYKYDTDFVYGFIQAMDSEKDPRNLVLCFEIIPLMCVNLSLGPFVDELFEVFSCYFPIDFTPPDDDPYGITKEKLVTSIRKCFSTTSHFGRHSIVLLLEKLESDVDDAKLDALLTYVDCAQVFNAFDYKDYIEPLWTLFQKLTMTTTSAQVETASLKAIEALTLGIGRSVQNNDSLLSLDRFIDKCVKSCLLYLNNVDLKLIWPNAKCLQSIAQATSTSNLIVFKEITKFLIQQIKYTNENDKELSKSKTYSDILWQFIQIDLKFNEKAPTKYLIEVKDDLFELCRDGIQSQMCVTHALRGLYLLFTYEKLTFCMNDEDIFAFLFEKISSDLESSDIEILIKIIFQVLSKNTYLVDRLIGLVQDNFKCFNPNLKKLVEHNTIPNFSGAIFELLVDNLVNKSNTNENNDDFILKNSYECVYLIIQQGLNANDYKNLYKLIDFLLEFKQINTNFLPQIAQIFQISAFKLDNNQELFENLLEKLNGSINKCFIDDIDSLGLFDYYLMSLLMHFFGSLDGKIFKEELKDFFLKYNLILFNLANYSSAIHHEGIHSLAAKFYASLLNKMDEHIINDVFDEKTKNQVVKDIEENYSLSGLQFLINIAKALVMREHKLGDELVDFLVKWLDNEKLTKKCSEAFYLIINDNTDYLNISKTHAVAKLFYKQKFFNFVFHKLKTKFEENMNNQFKISYVTAVSSTLVFLPKKLVQQHLASMLPMLIYSLKHFDGEVSWLISIRSLQDLIDQQENHKFLYECMSDLLMVLYKLSKNMQNIVSFKRKRPKRTNSTIFPQCKEIRLISINCLLKLSSLKPQLIIKYQKEVVKNLSDCLDDPKRIVRQKAVAARNKWFLLTTKEE